MANDFSGEASVFGVYNFESGARTTDSGPVGTNTLTEVNTPTDDAVNFKQGSQSIRYTYATNERSYRSDANLSAGFPLKSSGGAATFSVTTWLRKIAHNSNLPYILAKYILTSGRSWALISDNNVGSVTGFANALYTVHGYNSGDSYVDAVYMTEALVLGQWYFMHFTYDSSTRQHRLRVWDDTASIWMVNSPWTNTPANAMYLSGADLAIGGRSDGSSTKAFDGNLDESVFWSGVLSDADANSVRAGTFGASGILPHMLIYRQRRR